MYIEGSNHTSGQTATLTSPQQPAPSPSGVQCFSMWYHMRGANIDRLQVAVTGGPQGSQVIWSKQNNQGDQWKNMQIEFTNRSPIDWTKQTPYAYQVWFVWVFFV